MNMNEGNSEKFIREEVRRILGTEKRLLNELSWGDDDSSYGGGPELHVFKTLFAPFVDVFKVAAVAMQDTASIVMDVTRYALTFDEKKRKDLETRFRARRQKYAAKMKVAFKSTEDIMAKEDLHLLALMAAPGAVFTKKAAEMVWNAADPIRDQVEEQFSGMLGIGDSSIAAATDRDKSPALFADLKRAFFGEGLDEIDAVEMILLEQEKEADKEPATFTDGEIEDEVNDLLKRSGKQEEFDTAWDEIISDKQDEIEEILKVKGTQVSLLGALSIAESVEDAEKVMTDLKAADVDLSEAFTGVMKEIETQVSTIKAGGKESEELIENLRKHPDAASIAKDAPAEAYYPLIEKGLLATAFGQAVDDAKISGVGELLGFVAEVSKDDLALIASMSPKGKEYSDLILSFRDELLSA
jgi:hypothetical protein